MRLVRALRFGTKLALLDASVSEQEPYHLSISLAGDLLRIPSKSKRRHDSQHLMSSKQVSSAQPRMP